MSERERLELTDWIRGAIAELVGAEPEAIEVDRPLTELGLSSRDAVGLVGELEEHLDRTLEATLVYEAPTIALLVERLIGAPAETTGADATVVASSGDDDLVAVVGIGCRLPGGVNGPAELWELLVSGTDAIGEVPPGRWEQFTPDTPSSEAVARATSRFGGFLDEVDTFDADFFGITPREAELMDPQQRMLLEVAWEALEHAGIDPETLRGSATGVFVGMCGNEYSRLTTAELARVEAWTATGVALSIAANRLSYVLDLRGPSLTVDTACSSSLVAVHQALGSLASGEISAAVVGGVNLLLAPAVTVNFDRAGALAADGRCKAFAADADGMVRAEGCGVVILKRLADARRDGDRVLAVVRGSGVNSDGRSNGMAAPNPRAQEDLLRSVYERAGVSVQDVDYVEAHGTGTLLGDPIEASALAAVMARTGTDHPLLLGSVKSNLGHLEGAAGIAGFIKLVLSLHHGVLPPSLHFHAPNPHIPFREANLEVVTESRPWPRYGGVARGGVSAFGFGGTNAHVIVEEAGEPEAVLAAPAEDRVHTLRLSGTSEERVRANAAALAEWLDSPASEGVTAAEVARTLSRRGRRGAVSAEAVGRGRAGLADALRVLASGEDAPSIVAPAPPSRLSAEAIERPVWVFSGYGSQWDGMGQRLLAEEPAFATAVDDLEEAFSAEAGYSLLAAIERGEQSDDVAEAQLTLFGMQLALAALWRSRGLEPGAVIGYSMGEVAAAVVSGALTVREGVRVMAVRSRLLQSINSLGGGAMAALELSAQELQELAGRFPDVGVAVYQAPRQSTVGGDAEQIRELVEHVEGLGRNAWVLKVSGAAHSAAVDPILPALGEQLSELRPQPAAVPCYSTVLEDPRERVAFDARYWQQNARRAVRFTQAISAAAEDGLRVFVEVAPHPIAARAMRDTLSEQGAEEALVVPTLRRGIDEAVALHAGVALLQAAGVLDAAEPAAQGGRLADLPTMRWQRRSFWVAPPARTAIAALPAGQHPLLGTHIEDPESARHLWSADVSASRLPWLADHQVHGVAVLAGAVFAEMALAAAAEAFGERGHTLTLTELQLHEVLAVDEHTVLSTSLSMVDSDQARVNVFARPSGRATAAVCHASALVIAEPAAMPAAGGPIGELDAAAEEIDVYGALRESGRAYGPAFAGVRDARVDGRGVATALVELPPAVTDDEGHRVHPVLLDVCLQTLAAAAHPRLSREQRERPHLLAGIEELRLYGPPGRSGRCTASVRAVGPDELQGTMRLVGDDGTLLLEARGVRLRRVERHAIPVPLADKLYEAAWQPSPPGGDEAGCDGWLIVGPGLEGGPHDGLPERFAQPLAVQASRLQRALQDTGAAVLSCGYSDEAELDEAIAALRARVGDGRAGVLFLAPRVAAAESATGSGVALSAARHVLAGVARTSEALRRSLGEHGFDEDLALGAGPAAVRLSIVTQGAAAVVDGEPGRPALASLSALSRVLAFSHPGLVARIVDLEPADDPQQPLASLLAELGCATLDDEVAWRGGTRYARRLVRTALDDTSPGRLPRAVRPGSYAISGGLTDQGLQIALWLARGGATRIALAGQRAGTASEQAILAEIEQRGVEVDVVLGDIGDGATARRLVAACTRDGAPLRGVIHAAGSFGQEPVRGFCDAADLERVWSARVFGAWHLHEATDGHDLDFWLVCSSASALLGAGGEVVTASADAWLEAFVGWRRSHGRVGQVIHWGSWGDAPARTAPAFVDPMTQREGIDALSAVIASRRPATAVMRFDLVRALADDPRVAAIPLFAALRDGGIEAPSEEVRGHARGVVERLGRTDPAAAGQLVLTRLQDHVAMIMGHRVEELDVQAPLTDLGIDSLMATRAKNAVEHDFDLVLPVRRLLQGASLADLAAIVVEELGLDVERSVPSAPAAERRRYVEPRDPTERWLARIWGEVLERRVGATDRFDELGGDEAAVEAVVTRVRARLGPNVDARELFAEPTLERQADLLRDALEGNAGAEVRVLRRGGSRAPLFLFHPAGGPASVYEPLVALLAHDQPVYGFERIEDARSVEEKASRYLAMLREIAPTGPYRLGGWSLGGCVAYEVACQLKQQGHEVELVAMLDTVIPKETALSERELLIERFGRFIGYLQETYEIGLEVDLEALVELEVEDQIELLLDTLERAGVHLSAGQIAHQRSSYIDSRIAERYRPERFDGRVVLYRASDRGLTVTLDPRYARDDDACGWDAFCSDLEIVHVTGDHTSIIDPPAVGVIASHLRNALAPDPVLSREAAA